MLRSGSRLSLSELHVLRRPKSGVQAAKTADRAVHVNKQYINQIHGEESQSAQIRKVPGCNGCVGEDVYGYTEHGDYRRQETEDTCK